MNEVHDIFKLRLMSLHFPPQIQGVYNDILSNQFKANDAARDNRIIEIRNKLNDITLQKIEALKLLTTKMLSHEDYNLLNETLINEKNTLDAEFTELSSIEASFQVYKRENNTMLQNLNSFFWRIDIDSQSEILDTILEDDLLIDKTHIVKMRLNPIFKLLIQKDSSDKNEESGHL